MDQDLDENFGLLDSEASDVELSDPLLGMAPLSDVIHTLASELQLLQHALDEDKVSPDDIKPEPAYLCAVIEELGQRLQEPTGLSRCQTSQQLPGMLVQLLNSRQHEAITTITTANTMYVIWCSLANPACPDVRREQRLLYEQAGLIQVVLELLADHKEDGRDRLMGHGIDYNCGCVLWNLSRQPELRRALLVANVAGTMIEQIRDLLGNSDLSLFDCDHQEGWPFFAGLTAANLVVRSVLWSPESHFKCSTQVQKKVIAVKMIARRNDGNPLSLLSNGTLDQMLGFLDDGWNLPGVAVELLELGFPIVNCLERGMVIGDQAAGACWHLSREQSALDGLVSAMLYLASATIEWCDLLLEQNAPVLLFQLLDPAEYNPEVQMGSAGALLVLLEHARWMSSDLGVVCKPSNGEQVKPLVGDFLKHSDKQVRVLLHQLLSLM